MARTSAKAYATTVGIGFEAKLRAAAAQHWNTRALEKQVGRRLRREDLPAGRAVHGRQS